MAVKVALVAGLILSVGSSPGMAAFGFSSSPMWFLTASDDEIEQELDE
jgi:hypothetical protein